MDYETTDDAINRLVAENAELVRALRGLKIAANAMIGSYETDPEFRRQESRIVADRYTAAVSQARAILARIPETREKGGGA